MRIFRILLKTFKFVDIILLLTRFFKTISRNWILVLIFSYLVIPTLCYNLDIFLILKRFSIISFQRDTWYCTYPSATNNIHLNYFEICAFNNVYINNNVLSRLKPRSSSFIINSSSLSSHKHLTTVVHSLSEVSNGLSYVQLFWRVYSISRAFLKPKTLLPS